MKIPIFFKALIFSLFILFTIPASHAMSRSIKLTTALSDSTADVNTLATIVKRVTEIQNMDKTNLTATDKKVLRNELKGLKSKADGLGKGVYLSVGAIIIVILLLILILK